MEDKKSAAFKRQLLGGVKYNTTTHIHFPEITTADQLL